MRLRNLNHTHNHSNNIDGERNARIHVWHAVRRSMFCRFQEAFSHPEVFVIPEAEIDAQGDARFTKDPDFDDLSLIPTIVDPREVPEELPSSLGLLHIDKEARPLVRLGKVSAVIPQLKLLFEAATPLSKNKNRRLFVIQEPDKRRENGYPNIDGPKPHIVGGILYFREQVSQVLTYNPPQVVQHFASAHYALRKTVHQAHNYGKERDELGQLLAQMRKGIRSLDLACGHTDALELRHIEETAAAIFTDTAERLSRCICPDKRTAHVKAAEASTLTDNKGKKNVSVSMAKVVGAENRLKDRTREMTAKQKYCSEDAAEIAAAIAIETAILREFQKDVLEAATYIEQKPAFATKAMTAEEVRIFRVSTLLLPEHLQSISLQPMLTYAQKLLEKDNALSEALRSGDRARAIDLLIHMHVIGKLHDVRSVFEDINLSVIEPKNQSVTALRASITRLRTVFDQEQIFRGVRPVGYEHIFQKLQKRLETIEGRLREYEIEHPDPEMFGRLKKYLKTIDLESIVRELP